MKIERNNRTNPPSLMCLESVSRSEQSLFYMYTRIYYFFTFNIPFIDFFLMCVIFKKNVE